MRALGWTFLLLVFIALAGGGVYGYFHYKGLRAERDSQHAKIAELETEIARSGKQKGALEAAEKDLSATRSELEKLRVHRAEAEKRLEMIKELTAKLQKMIDTGKLGVVTRDGRMIVQMPAEVLFESGSAELSEDGKKTLQEVAAILKTDPDRKLIVAGHTDNQPIADAKFRNNWQLSAERAVIVTEVLVASGLKAKNLMAAGLSEYHPVGDNRTGNGRQTNRRIELVIQPPELEALPQIAEVVGKTAEATGQAPPAASSSAAAK